ncbi:MAG: arylsulfatase A-like enzyme [Verrucomicrobiales bacterium]|jgi:arylsulfatase A-like enzyme
MVWTLVKRRIPILLFLTVIATLTALADERPNVILILSDDHNYRALGIAGNEVLRTPNLNRLAEEGVFFNRCFTPNPICTPSRASLYTGQDSWTNGVTFNGKTINEDSPLLPKLLADTGYETCFIGKWHNDGKPWTRGYTTGGRCWAGGKFDHFELALTPFGGGPESRKAAEDYSTTVFTDDAVSYLEVDHAKPFLMTLAYTVGHDAFLAPPGYEGKYDPEEIPVPPNFMPKPPFEQFFPKIRDETVLPLPRTKKDVRAATAEYYAMIEHMDAQIGRILTTLREKEIEDETLVIFASVKGLSLGSHGIIGKQTMYEEGIRTSLILRHPTLQRSDAVNSNLVSTIDILPTICEAAGVAIPASVEGESLLGLYDGSREGRERIFASYHDPNRMTVTRAIRTDRYKLIQHLVTGEQQLFDLSSDPYELTNLIAGPDYREVEGRLTRELLRWRESHEEK